MFLLVLPLVFAGGCSQTEVVDLADGIEQLAIQTESLAAELEKSELVDPNELAEYKKAIMAFKALPDKIRAGEYDSDEIVNVLKVLQTANTSSTPWNPYAVPIGLGLSTLIAVARLWQQGREKKVIETKYAAHKAGAERAMRLWTTATGDEGEAAKKAARDLYEGIGEERKARGIT